MIEEGSRISGSSLKVIVPLGSMTGRRNCSIRGEESLTGDMSDGVNISISPLGAIMRSVRKS